MAQPPMSTPEIAFHLRATVKCRLKKNMQTWRKPKVAYQRCSKITLPTDSLRLPGAYFSDMKFVGRCESWSNKFCIHTKEIQGIC